MANPGPNAGGQQNSVPASIAAGNNVTYTFATLPPASNFAPGFTAITSDEGLCVVTAQLTWEIIGSSAGVAIQAGTNSLSSGTVSFANSNGVTFGMNTAGVITATVTPGAAAGIAAVQLPNTTYTSGTVNFINSNGLSFGSTTGGGVTASYNSTQFAGTGTTFAGTNISGSITHNSLGINLALSGPTESGIGLSAAGSSQTIGNLVLSNSNGLSFGMNGSTITGSYNSTQFAGTGTTFAGANLSASMTLNSAGLNLSMSGPVESGIGLSAAGSSQTAGNIVFSNSNGVSFGMNGSTVTASVAAGGAGLDVTLGGNTSGVLALVSTGTLFLAGGNNITLSQNGNSVTVSGANAGGAQTGISGIVVSNTTYSSGTITFQNANGISFGSSGANGISASYTVPAQTVQTEGMYAIGNTTGQSSSSTFDARTMSVSGAGGVSVGYSGNALLISGAAGSSQTEAIYIAGNSTGQSSQSTYTVGSFNISAAGIVSVGWSSNSLIISSPGTTGLTQLSAGFSTGGNTAGTTGLASAQLVLAGGNNITLSGSTNAGSMTVSIVGAAGGGVSTAGLYGLGNTTQNSSTTLNLSALSFNGLGEITVGYSNGSIQLSAPGQSIGASNIGNTSGNTGTYAGQVIFAGGNNITLSVASGAAGAQTITISGANAAAAQTGISGLQVSNTTYTSGTVSLVNANGISFGSSGANGISASYTVPAQLSTIGLYALGNTTQNSSTTLNQSALSFNALGPMTMGYSNGSIQVSAPATSSISGINGISVSVNGSTISISAISSQLSLVNMLPGDVTTLTQIGQGSVQIYPGYNPQPFSASRADVMMWNSMSSSSNSSHAGAISINVGLYTRTGSTLSLASSGSQSYAWTDTSGGSFSLISGLRQLSVPINANFAGGDIWAAVMSQTASTNANWFTAQNVVVQGQASQFNGVLGSASNATLQLSPGMGVFSTTSAALPSSMAFSQITGLGQSSTGANAYMAPVQFRNF